MKFLNVHERQLGDRDAMRRLLAGLGSTGDAFWPHDRWPRLRLDGPLAPGARGGHGPVRYVVEAVEPDRIRCRFTPPARGFAAGLHGHHEFTIDDGTTLRHTIAAEAHGLAVLKWLLIVRPLHDALLEDALDRASIHVGQPFVPARHSWWVRLLRR